MTYNPLDHVPLTHWLLLGPLLIAAYTDIRYGMIYNWLTFPTILVGLAINVWLGGWSGLLWAAIGLVGGFILLMPGYLMGGMAAGDVKLMAAIGAWLRWPDVLLATIYSLMLGGLLALLHTARHGTLRPTLRRLWNMLVSVAVPGLKADVDFSQSESPPFVYGPALALGTLLWMARSGYWQYPSCGLTSDLDVMVWDHTPPAKPVQLSCSICFNPLPMGRYSAGVSVPRKRTTRLASTARRCSSKAIERCFNPPVPAWKCG